MVKVQDVINVMEQFAPPMLAESYDNVGLLVGSRDMLVKGVLLTLDVTEESVEEAKEKGLNLIVSHHPLIFSGLKSITGTDYIQRVVLNAIKNDIAIFACHTNADSTFEGVSYSLGHKLGLEAMTALQCAQEGDVAQGLGVVGVLREPEKADDFLSRVKATVGIPIVRHTNYSGGKKISRVALCGGSGASLINNAISAQADIYLTGDLKYHDFFGRENSIILVDIGHFESEESILDVFYSLLTKNFTTFVVCKTMLNCNPIKYL